MTIARLFERLVCVRGAPRPSSSPNSFHGDRRGAVLVEFIIACMPLLITFFAFVQLAQITTARIVVKHATLVGARAAAVISNVNGTTPDQNPWGTDYEVGSAVKRAMGPWRDTMQNIDVSIDDKSSCDDVYGPVTVTVVAEYQCSVPFGGFIVCGVDGGIHTITQKFTFPHQGGRYADLGGSQCWEGKGKNWVDWIRQGDQGWEDVKDIRSKIQNRNQK